MTYRERVIRGSVTSEHVAQLFDSEESLSESVTSFLMAAYDAGDNLLVVAKPQHWGAVARSLRLRGCDPAIATSEGRLVVLDAAKTIDQIRYCGVPNPQLFDEVVGTTVRRLCTGNALAIYGEMVELLAQEADFAAALELEELWNKLAERCSYRLLCGYSSAHFVSRAGSTAFHKICSAHARVERQADDLLAGWLLTSRASA